MKRCRDRMAIVLAGLALALLWWAGASAQAAGPLTITEKDTGRAFTVKVGQKLVVDLRNPGSGGYDVLAPEYDARILKLLGQRRQPRTDPRRMGDFGRVVFEFEVLKTGQTDLVVPIKRPWEKQSEVYLKVKISVVR